MRSAFILIIAVFILHACSNTEKSDSEKRIISVSILPQKYFVEELAGDEFEVNVLIPPGASPASYDPTPKQLRDLNKSGLYLAMGHLGFELAWMESITRNHKELKVIDLSAGIDLITGEEMESGHEEGHDHGPGDAHDHDHSGIDPHIWMSPKSAAIMVDQMAKAINRYEPACQDLVLANLSSLLERIDVLDRRMDSVASQLKNKKFIIFHPALTYLARDYGLEQIPMEFGGKEPSASYMKKIIDRAKAENINTVFIQKEFDQNNARQIARELDARLIQIDPLAADWEAQMKETIDAFANFQ